MIPIVFEDDIDLMHFADEFIVKDRLASLENDVNRCLPTAKIEEAEYAPFPAVLFFYRGFARFPLCWECKERKYNRQCGKIHGKIPELP